MSAVILLAAIAVTVGVLPVLSARSAGHRVNAALDVAEAAEGERIGLAASRDLWKRAARGGGL